METSVKVENMTKKFGDFVANDNLSFEVAKGEVFGFLGANGAGKTTAIRILCGLLRPSSGKVEVAGYDVYKEAEMIKRNIGYMSQRFSLYNDMTISENIRFYGGIYGLTLRKIKEKTAEYFDTLNLWPYKGKFVKDLPLGIKQKLAFSVAGIHEPKIIFLDEPTSGVDPLTRRQFWDLIYAQAQSGKTIFVTTHYMDEAEYCDRLIIMDKAKIVASGSPSQLKIRFATDDISDIFLLLARGTSNYKSER